MLPTLFDAPRGGGSAKRCFEYLLCEEAAHKVTHALAKDNPILPEQYAALRALYAETDARKDLGVGHIFEPQYQDGVRPAAMLFEGVTAVSTAAEELEAIAKTQSRLGAPIDHLGFSHTTEQSKTITNEQVIHAARDVVKRVYGEGYAAGYIVHRDTLVWETAEPGLYVSGKLEAGIVRGAKKVEGQFVDGKFARKMGPNKRPLPGVPLGRDVAAGELIDGNVHCHTVVGVLHGETLKARDLAGFYGRLHKSTRESEIAFNLPEDFGLYVTRDRGLATQRIERTADTDWDARHRRHDDERLSKQVRSFISDELGRETDQMRAERIQNDLRKYLDGIAARKEQPLMSDVYNVAATLGARIERDDRGQLVFRRMERPEPGAFAREVTDEFGERQMVMSRWIETDVFLPVDAKAISPSPGDGGTRKLTKYEGEKHRTALQRRQWLAQLGDETAAQAEIRGVVKDDPGRVTRDIVNGEGLANFGSDDVTRWMQKHITHPDDWKPITDAVLRDPRAHIAILSSITEQPLYTTIEQKNLSEKYVALVERMITEKDPTYNRDLLERAADEEEAVMRRRDPAFAYSDEQRAACHAAASHRYTALEAVAGAGKTASQAIMNRYMQKLGRHTHGFSTAQRAAEVLQKESGISAINEARADTLRTHAGVEMVQPHSFNILEEGSMISLRAAYTLLKRVDEQGGSAIKIGGRAQLTSIEAGDPFSIDIHASVKANRHIKLTKVYRQEGPEVLWLREWIPKIDEAITAQDQAAFKVCVQEFIKRGHVRFYKTRGEMIDGIAVDIVDAIKRGESVIAPMRSKNEIRFINSAVKTALGLDGTGLKYKLIDGERELAPGVRVTFKKNSTRSPFRKEQDQLIHFVKHDRENHNGVLNGYTGSVRAVTKTSVTVELDNGDTIKFNPREYPHLDYGWSATTHVYQGTKSPLVVGAGTKADDAHSFYVAASRCTHGLHIHTPLEEEELVERLSADRSLAGPRDAMLFQKIVDATGGSETVWARNVRAAAKDEKDPLRQRHRAAMAQRTQERNLRIAELIDAQPKRTVARDREQAKIFADYPLETFVTWAARERRALEEEWARRVMRPSSMVEQARAEARQLDEQIRLDRIEAANTAQRELHQRNLTIARASCTTIKGTKAAEYLAGRGVHAQQQSAGYAPNWPAGVTTNSGLISPGYGPAVVFQFRTPAGDIVAAQGRFLDPPVFDGQALKTWSVGAIGSGVFWTSGAREAATVAICEAPIDALSLAEIGLPAIALGGTGNQPAFLADLLAGRKVVLALDADAPGLDATIKLETMLQRSEMTRLKMPPGIRGAHIKDVNEALTCVPDSLRYAVQSAQARLGITLQPERKRTAAEIAQENAKQALRRAAAIPDPELEKKKIEHKRGHSIGR